MQKIEFPQEHLVELRGLSPHLMGRITVYKESVKFNLEIDIIQSESGKIYNHVKSMFGETDLQDALSVGVMELKKYLDSKK